MEDEVNKIARNIKYCIETSGMTVVQVAEKLGTHNRQIYAYIRGDYLPGAIIIKKLCKILHCTYEDLLGSVN